MGSLKQPSTIILSQSLKKEKSHVVDYHRNSNHPVAARFLGWKHQPKLSENRQLDPCFDRYRRHPHRFETIGDRRVLDFRLAIVQVDAAFLAVAPPCAMPQIAPISSE